MTTETITLSSFLLARIAEDEEAAREATPGRWTAYGDGVVLGESPNPEVCRGVKSWNMWHISNHDPARVLAECAAKRALVKLHGGEHVCWQRDYPVDGEYGETVRWGDCTTMTILAMPFADHLDFDEAWRA